MLKIGEFSKLSRISVRMLRHYDETGLLPPAETDPFTGYRYYREEQLAAASRITALKDMGFSLASIREILSLREDRKQLEIYFCARERELKALAEETAYRLRLMETARAWLRKDETKMTCNVTVKTIPERKVASVRMILPSYEAEGTAWGILCAETDSIPLIPDDPCLCCAIFHDEEYKESDVDVEIQKTVVGQYQDTEHVRFKTLPPVTVASCIHTGSYQELDAAMNETAQWVKANGYEFDGAAFNIYHVSPHETSDETQFVTEVCYPVRKK